jgi:uncharacterized protein YbjT (DUF2867 family)
MAKHAIITGGAGFIGSHLVDLLMQEGGWRVSVLDNFHPAYPRAVKEANIAPHHGRKDFDLVEGDILDNAAWEKAFAAAAGLPTVVVHLAALAGVRASMADPPGLPPRERDRQPHGLGGRQAPRGRPLHSGQQQQRVRRAPRRALDRGPARTAAPSAPMP